MNPIRFDYPEELKDELFKIYKKITFHRRLVSEAIKAIIMGVGYAIGSQWISNPVTPLECIIFMIGIYLLSMAFPMVNPMTGIEIFDDKTRLFYKNMFTAKSFDILFSDMKNCKPLTAEDLNPSIQGVIDQYQLHGYKFSNKNQKSKIFIFLTEEQQPLFEKALKGINK